MRAPRLLGDLASAFTMPTVLKLTAGSQPNSCYSPFLFAGFQAQPYTSRFTYRRAAFFNTLKSKTGLMAARAAALRTNINIDGRPLPPRHGGELAASTAPPTSCMLLPPTFTSQ